MPAPANGIADRLDPGGINRRLADLERQVRELRAAKRLEAATIGAGGLVITASGGLSVIDDYNNLLLALGALSVPFTGGATQYGLVINRQNPDGTPGQPALTMFTSDGPPPQTLGLYDAAGNNLWTDDGIAAQGIGRPYLSFPMVPYVSTLWPSTTAGAWTPLYIGEPPKQQPQVIFAGAVSVPSGVTGQLRLYDALNNVQIGSTVTVSSAPGGTAWEIGPAPVTGAHMTTMLLELQAQITAGAGTIAAIVYASYGCQS